MLSYLVPAISVCHRRDAESRGLTVRGSMIHHVVSSYQQSLTIQLLQPPHFLKKKKKSNLILMRGDVSPLSLLSDSAQTSAEKSFLLSTLWF